MTDEVWTPHFPVAECMPWPGGGYLRRDDVQAEARIERMFSRTGAAPLAGLRSYHGPKDVAVLATIDQTDRFGDLLHVSLSFAHRDPKWSEIKIVRALFFPDTIDVMMMLPAAEDYVNIHEHTFHMQQTPERWKMR